jgi:hypothetical protein
MFDNGGVVAWWVESALSLSGVVDCISPSSDGGRYHPRSLARTYSKDKQRTLYQLRKLQST